MKDLYRRGNLKPYEADRNRILDCDGFPEDIEAACVVLLDAERKAEYDRCYSVLKTVAQARKNLSVSTSDTWKNKYRDFYYHQFNDAIETPIPQPTISSRKLIWLKFGGVATVGVLLILLVNEFIFKPQAEIDEQAGKLLTKEVYSYSTPIRESADHQAKILQELKRYNKVDVLVERSTPEWDFVRVKTLDETPALEGFVFSEHLSIGNNEAEEIHHCRELGVERPSSGFVLNSLTEGKNRIEVVNSLSQDAVIKIKNASGIDIASFYVWGHQTAAFDHVPDGVFRFSYAKGANYSRTCGRFLDQMQALEAQGDLNFAKDNWASDSKQFKERTYVLSNDVDGYNPVPPRLF